MNLRRQRFVEEYLVDLNATQAAIRAGYAPNSADVTGSRLLGKASVAAAIERRKAARAVKSGVTQERVLEEYRALAMSDVSHYQMSDGGHLVLAPGAPPNAMAAVSSIKRKVFTDDEGRTTYELEFKLWDKPGALKITGKHVDLKGAADTLKIDFSDAPDAVLEYLAKKGL